MGTATLRITTSPEATSVLQIYSMEGNICQVSHLKNIKLLCNWYQLTRKEARRRDSSFFFQLNNFKKCVASFFIYAVSEKISTHLITIPFLFKNQLFSIKTLKQYFGS